MIGSTVSSLFLVTGIVMAVLVINMFFRKHARMLLWAEGLLAIIGSCLAIGLGWIRLNLPDGQPNFPAVTVLIVLLCSGALFILTAEKLHKKIREKENQTDSKQSTTEADAPTDESITTLPLKGKLDTPLAHIIFRKAIEAEMMAIVDINDFKRCYQWKGSKVLLAYMCGRIYCSDTSTALTGGDDVVWTAGKGIFPSNDLDRLFNVKDLGQQRSNRLDKTVPKDFGKVDRLFG